MSIVDTRRADGPDSVELSEHRPELYHRVDPREPVQPLACQEIWAWLLVHHALSALITRAAQAADLDPDRISFTRVLRLVRRTATGTAAFPP